jgi:hypothetical protein
MKNEKLSKAMTGNQNASKTHNKVTRTISDNKWALSGAITGAAAGAAVGSLGALRASQIIKSKYPIKQIGYNVGASTVITGASVKVISREDIKDSLFLAGVSGVQTAALSAAGAVTHQVNRFILPIAGAAIGGYIGYKNGKAVDDAIKWNKGYNSLPKEQRESNNWLINRYKTKGTK